MESEMVLGSKFGQIMVSMRDNGKTMFKTEREDLSIQMEMFMMVTGKMENFMVVEQSNMMMDLHILVIGWKAKNTARELKEEVMDQDMRGNYFSNDSSFRMSKRDGKGVV